MTDGIFGLTYEVTDTLEWHSDWWEPCQRFLRGSTALWNISPPVIPRSFSFFKWMGSIIYHLIGWLIWEDFLIYLDKAI